MHLSFGNQAFYRCCLVPFPTVPTGASLQAQLMPHSLHNDCVWVTFSNPSSLCPPTTSTAPAAPLALLSPRGPQHRLGLINPHGAPECPSQPHVSHPPGRVPACLCGQCHGPSTAPAVPDAAWACGAGGPHGGHPDFKGQLPPGAPGELQAGRSRGTSGTQDPPVSWGSGMWERLLAVGWGYRDGSALDHSIRSPWETLEQDRCQCRKDQTLLPDLLPEPW